MLISPTKKNKEKKKPVSNSVLGSPSHGKLKEQKKKKEKEKEKEKKEKEKERRTNVIRVDKEQLFSSFHTLFQ